jgi:DNA-binding beta-propeller fold protein YncE
MKPCFAILLVSLAVAVNSARAQKDPPLRLVQTIALPDVEGRIDHFGVDLSRQRLFMSALGNGTLEVFDLRAGKRIQSIKGLREPQGVFYVPESNKIFVASGGDGTCKIFDGDSYALVRTVDFGDDADNVRYDAAAKRIYVGYGEGALGVLDAMTGDRVGDVKLAGHPESFRLESSGPRVFVNVPNAGHIAVADRKKFAVTTQWPMGDAGANFPMALDEAHHRLFVGFRRPAKLAVFDSESGKIIASVPCVGDTDDLFYDPERKSIYISGGEGFISVIGQRDSDHFEPVAKIPTSAGARTSFFVPELKRLYLAVPHRGNQKAELRVYEVAR